MKYGTKPWSYPEVYKYCQDAAFLRMQLLPYLYSAFAGYYLQGEPPFRAMNLVEGFDGRTQKIRTKLDATENPELVYGFGLNTTYKQFDFGFFFQGNALTSRMIGRDTYFMPGSTKGVTGNIYTNARTEAWTEDNPSQDSFYPRLRLEYSSHNSQASTWWLKDMSMLRLKNVEIGYSVPTKVFEKISLSYGRIYLRANNLFKFSKFKLWDPELNTSNGLKYPIMRSFSIGLQVKF